MRKSRALGVVLALFGGLMVTGMGAASAHVPSASATCDGVVVTGKHYAKEATLTASVEGGSSDSKAFTGTDSLTVQIPQDGAVHNWTAEVISTHGENSQSFSGAVGPCGTPPQPPAEVDTKDESSPPDCETLLVTTTHSSRTIPYVHDDASNSWVPGTPGPWEVTGTETRHVTLRECDAPPMPDAIVQVRDVSGTPNCESYTTSTGHQSREGIFVFNDSTWSWTQDGWTPWVTTGSDTVDATQLECPPPAQPDPTASVTTSESHHCGDAFASTITTTSTRAYVLDEATRTWSLGDPAVVHETTRTPITEEKCPETTSSAESALLPNTGGPNQLLAMAAGFLLLLGISILSAQHLMPAASDAQRTEGASGIDARARNVHHTIARLVTRFTPPAWRGRRAESAEHSADDRAQTHGWFSP